MLVMCPLARIVVSWFVEQKDQRRNQTHVLGALGIHQVFLW